MKVDFTKHFGKQFAKLPDRKQIAAKAAISLWLDNPAAPKLRLHKLKGNWLGQESISAGGDLRLHYRRITANEVLFTAVGSHSQLYG